MKSSRDQRPCRPPPRSGRERCVSDDEDVEIIRRLVADYDPAAGSITDAHADPHGQATLERILATPTAKTGRGARRRWPDALLPAVVWAAIAATFVFLVIRTVDAGSPAVAATPAPLAYHLPEKAPSGRDLLLRLAAVAERQPVTHRPTQAYAYVRTAGSYFVTQSAGTTRTPRSSRA